MSTLNILTPTDFANGIPEIWVDALRYDASRKAVTKKFEGVEGSKNAIIRKDDLSKKNGDTLHFQTMSKLYGKGRTAAQTLEAYEEKPTLGQFDLTVALLRHAISYRDDTDVLSLYKAAEWARPLLSDWYARVAMDDAAFTQMISTASPTTIYAGNASSEATLAGVSGGDTVEYTLGVPELKRAYYSLLSMGAEPISVESKNGQEIPIYGAWLTEFDMNHLESDATYQQINQYANVRGESNPLFTSARGMLFGGLMLYSVPSVRGHGSALRPEAKVYGSHTAIVATITVGSDTDGIIDYTKDFASSGTLAIQNTSGAIEYVTYTGKTTYSFTGCIRGVTYNGIASTASAYTGGATNAEWVTQGHQMSKSIIFGANALLRGFAKTESEIKQTKDYANELGIGVKSVHGHKEVLDSGGVVKNYVLLKSCASAFDCV